MNNVNSMISDLRLSRQLIEALTREQKSPKNDLYIDVNAVIDNTDALLTAIIAVNTELCRLTLNLCERAYIDYYVNPLLTSLFNLSIISFELSLTVLVLSYSPIVPPKKSKLKSTIHLIYEINEECEDLLKVLKKRLKPLAQVKGE